MYTASQAKRWTRKQCICLDKSLEYNFFFSGVRNILIFVSPKKSEDEINSLLILLFQFVNLLKLIWATSSHLKYILIHRL